MNREKDLNMKIQLLEFQLETLSREVKEHINQYVHGEI